MSSVWSRSRWRPGATWQFLVRLMRRRFSAVLAERARLAREIHDTLLQNMIGVALQFDALADIGALSVDARHKLVRARKQAEGYIRDARQSIWDLRSPSLERRELSTALREIGIRATQDTAVEFIAITIGDARQCSTKVENALLRIGQEAITNAIRHSHADRIDVDLRFESETLTLRVRDNGCGFDAGQFAADSNGHYGLISMRERAEDIEAEFSISSAAARGTDVETVVTLDTDGRSDARKAMAKSPIRVLCVDDHRIVREGISLIIERQPDMEVVGAAATGEQAIRLFNRYRPDITLMDLQLGRMSGLEAIAAIRGQHPKARIVVLTTYDGDEDIYRALEAGAATYPLNDVLSDELIRVVRQVHAGQRPIGREVQARLDERASHPPLTPREIAVLELVTKGMRNKEIGARLDISEDTVAVHLRNTFATLKVKERTTAVTVALRRGIIHLR